MVLQSQWMNYWRETYTYNSNRNVVLGIMEEWNDNQWIARDGSLALSDLLGGLYGYYFGSELSPSI